MESWRVMDVINLRGQDDWSHRMEEGRALQTALDTRISHKVIKL